MATDRSLKTKALQDKASNFVMLAHKYDPNKHVIDCTSKRQVSIKHWMAFEKIDGIRGVYKDGKILSRYGNEFTVPKRFIDIIQDSILLNNGDLLDGELVSTKGFQHTTSIVRDQSKKATMEYWKYIKFVIFDFIAVGSADRFIDRHRSLMMSHITETKHIEVLKPLGVIQDNSDVFAYHKEVKNFGGEGIMLRNPDSLHKCGRSWDLLKVKEFQDIECKVTGYFEGEGRNKDVLGGVTCELDNGITFDCGTGFSDEQRRNPPKIGSRITVRFFEYTDQGRPRFPVYIGVRDYE